MYIALSLGTSYAKLLTTMEKRKSHHAAPMVHIDEFNVSNGQGQVPRFLDVGRAKPAQKPRPA